MRISMWILADWLKEYHPKAEIQEGERSLRNVRLFSEGRRLSKSTVYLEKISDEKIICMNSHDIIVLQAKDINAVFNSILDAFEFYNDWSSALYESIHGNCSLKELLDGMAPVFPAFLIFADATFLMRETAGAEEFLHENPAAQDAIDAHIMPLESLLELNLYKEIRIPGLPTYVINVPGVGTKSAVTNITAGGIHSGWLISVSNSGEYTKGWCSLQDVCGDLVAAWLLANKSEDQSLVRSGLIAELLKNEEPDRNAVSDRLRAFGWYPGDEMQLYLICQTDFSKSPFHAFDRHLEHLDPQAFFVHNEGKIILLRNLNLSLECSFDGKFSYLLKKSGCTAVKSLVFTDIFQLRDHFRAAETVLGLTEPSGSPIMNFREAELDYIADILKTNAAVDVRHPALAILERYDRTHDGDFNQTLEAFLENDCNYADTARELYIHRSTLLYRIHRIEELTGISFQDAMEKLHLRISFLLGG